MLLMVDSRRNGKIRKLVVAQDCTNLCKLSDLVVKLNSHVDVTESIDRLSELANHEENVDLFFAYDVVPALVRQLKNDGQATRSA
ncbi:hypothetical protein HanIR_Chr15g0733131 [Helianthus annuus]|nr:hypothetical protein HanIR_Chr15g0733131 [Helianthus annuus]